MNEFLTPYSVARSYSVSPVPCSFPAAPAAGRIQQPPRGLGPVGGRSVPVAAVLFVAAVSAFCDITPASGAEVSSEQIRTTAEQVMQQRDFRSVRRRILENRTDARGGDGFLVRSLSKMGEAIGDFFEWLFSGMFTPRNRVPQPPPPASAPPPPPSTSSGGIDLSLGSIALYLGLSVLVVIAIWIIATVIKSQDGSRRIDKGDLLSDAEGVGELNVPPGELAASTYESRALKMAADSNFRSAIRELLIGSMSWIERSGLIRFRKGLTNRDYLRAVWRDEPRRGSYHAIAVHFERIYFGRRDATAEMFADCLEHFQGAFREEETATAAR